MTFLTFPAYSFEINWAQGFVISDIFLRASFGFRPFPWQWRVFILVNSVFTFPFSHPFFFFFSSTNFHQHKQCFSHNHLGPGAPVQCRSWSGSLGVRPQTWGFEAAPGRADPWGTGKQRQWHLLLLRPEGPMYPSVQYQANPPTVLKMVFLSMPENLFCSPLKREVGVPRLTQSLSLASRVTNHTFQVTWEDRRELMAAEVLRACLVGWADGHGAAQLSRLCCWAAFSDTFGSVVLEPFGGHGPLWECDGAMGFLPRNPPPPIIHTDTPRFSFNCMGFEQPEAWL